MLIKENGSETVEKKTKEFTAFTPGEIAYLKRLAQGQRNLFKDQDSIEEDKRLIKDNGSEEELEKSIIFDKKKKLAKSQRIMMKD